MSSHNCFVTAIFVKIRNNDAFFGEFCVLYAMCPIIFCVSDDFVCPALPSSLPNTRVNCTVLSPKYSLCLVSCEDGFVYNSSLQLYMVTCSNDTNYNWSIDVRTLPPCQGNE